jgi:hypothetical protein
LETNENKQQGLLLDLKRISEIISDDYPYTQQKTETFLIDIEVINQYLMKVIISHQRYTRLRKEEWIEFANSCHETTFFKEYFTELKKIVKKYKCRIYIPKKDPLEIRIIKK